MKIQIATAALGLAILSSSANAQDTNQPLGFAIRGGVVFPLDSKGRDEGKTWFGGGVDFRLPSFGKGMSKGQLQLSADYYQKGDLSAVPVLLNYYVHNGEIFYSAGAGIAITRDFEVVSGARVKRTKTQFAYQFGIGYEFKQGSTPLFAEAKFFGNSVSALNAVGIYLGIRL